MDLELKRRLGNIDRLQQHIMRQQDVIIRGLAQVVRLDVSLLNQERQDAMSIKDTIATLQNDVRDNKDATASVQAALETYAKANGDLTQQLKDALDKADLDGADETALKQIAADLEANNSALHAAAPATAAAVVENTPAQV